MPISDISTKAALHKSFGRSRVTNRPGRFVEASGKSPWGRRFGDIVSLYIEHLGHHPSPAELSLIRRIATLECELERDEGLRAEDAAKMSVEVYARIAAQLRRLLEAIGIQSPKLIEHEPNTLLGHFQKPAPRASA